MLCSKRMLCIKSLDFSKPPQWLKVVLISLFLLPTAVATLMFITQSTYAGNAMYGKLILKRCVRTKTRILLSYNTQPLLLVDNTPILHSAEMTNLVDKWHSCP
jgi:hypothetical protein